MIEKNAVLREFFIKEFDTLQMKTGIRQLENMAKEKTFDEDMNQLIEFMIEECNKPPFDLVGVDIKMSVIREAIVEDKDFIGLNAKFVRRSLGSWWQFNGGRYLEKHMQSLPKEEQPEPAPPEVREKYLKEWEEKVKAAGSRFSMPALTPEEIKLEGQEKPNLMQEQLDKLAPKASYQSPPDYIVKVRERIRKICADTYKHLDPYRMPKGFDSYRVNDYDIFCESHDKAKEIYEQATKL